MQVTNSDRIAAALLRLEQAERLVLEARKIFSYAEKQEDVEDWGSPVEGLYPGQKSDITLVADEEMECET